MRKVSLYEEFINEKREDVGKYNTVKKVIAELGRRPSEQELASFINNNYYDVTEVERGEDDPAANDKIADLVAFYKFDIDDWQIAWADAQNESVVTEALASSSKIEKNLNKALKANINMFGDNNETIKVLDTPVRIERSQYDKEMNGRSKNFGASIMYMYGSRTNEYNTAAVIGVISRTKGTAKVFLYSEETYSKFAEGASFKEYEGASVLAEFQNKTRDVVSHLSKFPADGSANESIVTEAKNTIGLAFKDEDDYTGFVEFIKDEKGSIKKDFGWDSKTKSWEVIMDVKVLDSIYGEGTPGNKESGWYGALPGDFESVIIESVVTEAKKYKFKELAKAWEFVYGEEMEDEYEGFYQEVVGKYKNKVTKEDIAEIWNNVYGEDIAVEYDGFFKSIKENLNESKKSEALADAISKSIMKIDDSMSYADFALAVGQILRDDYGQHNFMPFMKVLHNDLGIK